MIDVQASSVKYSVYSWSAPPPKKKNESFNHKFISYNLFSDLDLGYAQTLSPESFNKDKGMQLALAEK